MRHTFETHFFLHNFFNIPWFSPRYANQLNTKYNPDSEWKFNIFKWISDLINGRINGCTSLQLRISFSFRYCPGHCLQNGNCPGLPGEVVIEKCFTCIRNSSSFPFKEKFLGPKVAFKVVMLKYVFMRLHFMVVCVYVCVCYICIYLNM